MSKKTEILGHDISWFVNSKVIKELDESSIDHIKECIEKGYTQGSLCVTHGRKDEKEAHGWWHVVDWKNIALDLFNVTGSEVNAQKAKKQFEENW